MPRSRPIKPRWCARDKAWLVPGSISEVTGRRKYVILRDENGQKIKGNDHLNKIKALRLLQERKDSGPLVRDVIRWYLEWHEARGSKASTISDHKFHLFAFGRFEYQGVRYYDRPASSIMLRDLARVRASMESRGCQSGYIRHLYSSVLACWRWSTRPIEGRDPERLLKTNALEGAERPRIGRSQKVVVPWSTIEELLQFAERRANYLKHPARASALLKVLTLRLIAESGCRPIEACSLEWGWIYEADRVIIIPSESHKTGRHRGNDRIIAITKSMSDMLALRRKWPQGRHPVWVFAFEGQTKPPSRAGLDHWFLDLRTRAIKDGIPIPPSMTLYSLRHSLVTQARQGGIPYRDLAVHMGHSEQVAEQVYSHLDPSFVRAQFDRMHAARTRLPE